MNMTQEEAIKILSSESYIGNSTLDDAIEYAIEALSEPTTITENMMNGIDEGIRCAMCTNPMANNRGCDGMCRVDKTMYKNVLDVINNVLYKGNYTMPTKTEPDCTDAISREEVTHFVKEFVNNEYATKEDCEFVDLIVDGVNHLPSVNPTTDLSKIRAEIEDYMMNFADSDSDNFIEFTAGLVLRQSCPYVLAIIDKYKGGDSDA